MRNIIMTIGMMLMPAVTFAAAPFVDQFNDHQHWIFYAYAYCLGFGLAVVLILFILTGIWRTKTRELTNKISSFLAAHRVLAIIVAGILLAIPFGIIAALLWELLWFMSIIPMGAMVIAFPFILVNRRFREKCLLTPSAIKWLVMIPISAIVGSLFFIILTDCGLLPQCTTHYLTIVRESDSGSYFYYPSHPYDSMKEIWLYPFVFATEIIVALILYGLGMLRRYFQGR